MTDQTRFDEHRERFMEAREEAEVTRQRNQNLIDLTAYFLRLDDLLPTENSDDEQPEPAA